MCFARGLATYEALSTAVDDTGMYLYELLAGVVVELQTTVYYHFDASPC